MFFQKVLELQPRTRGFHIITDEIVSVLPELREVGHGMLNILIQHTSAGISINENADPTVRLDFESFINKLVPENLPYFQHTLEGSDDMPAHIKAAIIGCSLNIPVTRGRLNLGTWQGIYLCEFRNFGGPRNLVLTVHGE